MSFSLKDAPPALLGVAELILETRRLLVNQEEKR